MTDARKRADWVARNRDAILEVLLPELPSTGSVLELASGTGEHAVHFAAHMPGILWQPSDVDAASLASCDAWRAAEGRDNVLPAIELNATSGAWPKGPFAAVVCMNLIHIAPWEVCIGVVRGASRVLTPGGKLFFYGPFRIGSAPLFESNQAFDERLRTRDPAWGIRDLDEVTLVARQHGLRHDKTIEMPANNVSVVFNRTSDDADRLHHPKG